MARESIDGPMATPTLGPSWKIEDRAMVFTNGKTEEHTKDNGADNV